MVGPYRSRLVRAALAAFVAAGFATACRGAPAVATLSDISSVDELKNQFNRDGGKPRIVLLLSPT
jgi:hypothetical protein